MEPSTTARLIELNRQFYTVFGPAFAATRRRIQEGVRRALGSLPIQGGTWLDVGCGSGSLAVEWLRLNLPAAYLGVDFSPALLAEAESAVLSVPDYAQERVSFAPVNLADEDWSRQLGPSRAFRRGFCLRRAAPPALRRPARPHRTAHPRPARSGRLVCSFRMAVLQRPPPGRARLALANRGVG